MASALANKTFLGSEVKVTRAARSRAFPSLQIVASSRGKTTNPDTVGVSSVENKTVAQNLKGRSRFMNKKGWVDPQGRKGKGLGVYRFEGKYGGNVDGYSPIYTPDIWADGGDEYSFGTKGILAWLGLLVVGFGVAANLIISTSQLAS